MQPLKKYKDHKVQGFLQYGYFVRWDRRPDIGTNAFQTMLPNAYLKKIPKTICLREVILLIKYALSHRLSEKRHLNIFEVFLKSQPVFIRKIIKR
jgi:hypothetical protein